MYKLLIFVVSDSMNSVTVAVFCEYGEWVGKRVAVQELSSKY